MNSLGLSIRPGRFIDQGLTSTFLYPDGSFSPARRLRIHGASPIWDPSNEQGDEMTERPPSYHGARQEHSDRAAQLEATDLSDVAVLEVDGIDALQTRPFPRQVAVAFADGRPARAWLIAPEALWNLRGSQLRALGVKPGAIGAHPVIAADEVLATVDGCRVYSRSPGETSRWLALFFNTGHRGNDSFEIHDLRDLTSPPGTSNYDLPSAKLRKAEIDAASLHSDATNPSRDAARAVHYIKAIGAIRRERDETLAREAQANQAPTSEMSGLLT